MTPRQFFRTVALAEAVTWTLLLIGMFLKYVTKTTDLLVTIGGGLHGFVFLAYIATTLMVSLDQRWTGKQTLMGLASAIPPYVTIPFERWAQRRGLLKSKWRLSGAKPRGGPEKLVTGVLQSPFVAAAIAIVGLGVLFAVMVSLGPPTEWGS